MRRATLTEHGRLVEDISDGFNEAVQAGDLHGFFERIAAGLMPDVRKCLETAHRNLDPIKHKTLLNNIAQYLRGD